MRKWIPVVCLIGLLAFSGCESAPAVPPTPTPDVPKYSSGEVVGLVQGMLRSHGDEECVALVKNWGDKLRATYQHSGKWMVMGQSPPRVYGLWYVYEGTDAIETAEGRC